MELKGNNISYKYHSSKKYVLKDVNIHIPSDKIVGLVGDSGSGKSTLCKILSNYIHKFEGEVIQFWRQGFLSGQNQCDPVLAELLVRQSIREKRFARLVAFVEQSAPMEYQHGRLQARYWRALRQFRIGLYSQNSQMIEDALAFLAQGECRALAAEMPTLIQILTCAFDPAWFAAMPVFLQFLLLDHLVHAGIVTLIALSDISNYLQNEVPARDRDRKSVV